MRRLATPILAALTLTGCTTSRATYTESPAPPAEVTVIIFHSTCTAWHVCDPSPEKCAALCCAAPRATKPQWFE